MNRSQQLSINTFLAVASCGGILAIGYWWHRRVVDRVKDEWQKKRQEERTGRIRAEVRLRTVLKETTTTTATQLSDKDCEKKQMTLQLIGTVVSPYTKRMGTPRQPQLVPSSRGYVEMIVPAQSLCGIEQYSHVWIIFEFHANTNIDKKRTKIRPPRGGGEKIGQLATRSPHRPNSIGLSLVKVERWEENTKRLHVSGLDLVHGTPVYDIKPCVPWDIPGYPYHSPDVVLKVPSWVNQDDAISLVEFTDESLAHLQEMVHQGRLAPLYTNDNDGYQGAMLTLKEVLAQDPRSSHKGLKENARGTTSTNSNNSSSSYNIIFGQCRVEFRVNETGVQVLSIAAVDFDPSSFVDGVPLISESKMV